LTRWVSLHSKFKSKRFDLRQCLGAGAFGEVYSAFDRVRRTDIAVKLLRRVDPTSIYQFKQEFRGLAGVTHPNLCVLYELGCEEDQWYFTMEWVDGTDLLTHVRSLAGISEPVDAGGDSSPAAEETRTSINRSAAPAIAEMTEPGLVESGSSLSRDRPVRRFSPLPQHGIAALQRVLRGVVDGVTALHQAGYLHRDLKPSNVMAQADGRAVVLDFGIATELRRSHSGRSPLAGTPAYMAPEQVAGDALTPASDWYAVGVMLYELLTGTRPFTGPPEHVLRAKLERAPQDPGAHGHLPAQWCQVCMSLLERDPANRAGAAEIDRLLGGASLARVSLPDVQTGAERDLLIGRDEHVGTLARAFAQLQAGHGQVTWVTGLSGMGKSTLCRRFVDTVAPGAGQPALVALFGRCYEQEQVRFKALDAVLDALVEGLLIWPEGELNEILPTDIAALARLFPVLHRLRVVATAARAHAAAANDSSQLRQRAFAGLRQLLRQLGKRCPVIIVIDDLQWADQDSITLLGEVLRPPAPPPIMLIATLRSEDPATAEMISRLNDSIRGQTGRDVTAMVITEVAVDRLSIEQATELARSLLAGPETGSLKSEVALRCQHIARECGGNPFFVRELALYARDQDVTAERDALSLERVLQARFAGLSSAMRRLLNTVAVAGRPLPREVAEVAADLGNEAQTAITALRNTHLVRISKGERGDRIEPYHDRVREAAVSLLDEQAQREQHGTLAHILEQLGAGDAEALAFHYEAAHQPDKARHYAEQAARESEAALAFERAAHHYRRALAMGADPGSGADSLCHRLADCLAAAGRGPEAAEAYLQAAEHADADTRLDCRIQAANHLMISGRIGPGLSALGGLLSEAGAPIPRSPLRSLARLLWYRLLRRLRGLGWRYRPEALIPRSLLAKLDLFDVAAVALGAIDTFRGADYQARRLLLALRAGEPRRVAQALALEGLYLASAGERAYAKARGLLERTRALALDLKEPKVDGWVEFGDGVAYFFSGQFDRSVASLLRSEQRFEQLPRHASWELDTARSATLASLRYAGRLREGYELAEEFLADARLRNDRYADVMARRGSHLFWLAIGPPGRAQREIAASSWSTAGDAFHIQHYAKMVSDAEIAIYEGSAAAVLDRTVAAVRAARRALLFQIEVIRASAYYTLARVLLVAAEEGRDPAQSEKAAAKVAARLMQHRVSYAHIWGLLTAAGVAARRGDHQGARNYLERAIGRADSCDSRMEGACARYALARLIGGPEGKALMAAAKPWFIDQSVAEPETLTYLVVPGIFARPA
jgi:eukaryotic-like serine/threonine-protein kinase